MTSSPAPDIPARPYPPSRTFPAGVGGGTVRRAALVSTIGLVVSVVGGVALGVVVVGTLIAGPVVAVRRRRVATGRSIESGIADVFELAARSVRVGVPVAVAVCDAATRTSGEGAAIVMDLWARSAAGAHRSVPSDVGIRRRAVHVEEDSTAVASAVLALAGGSTGGGARALEAGALLLRERHRARAEVTAGASHARASAGLLVSVPVLFGVASLGLDPSSGERLLADPIASAAVVVGICLQVVGALWITRLVRATRGVR